MRFGRLGGTGTEVSAICLGCMGLADPAAGTHPWAVGWERSREVIAQALDAGINFFDTANVYSKGSSEEYLGRALRELGVDRDEVVIATKVHGRMREGPNGAGLSRKAILAEIDHSLRRLGLDHVDLYQVHRWDYETPVEETLAALDEVVRAGKARHIGASSMWAWQFAKALHLQQANGWARYATMQDHYNLLYREEEREMLPLCADEGVGSIPWSPLARGKLTRDWDETTTRGETDEFGKTLYQDSDRHIVEKVAEIADKRGVSRAQVALAWVMANPVVDAPIIGATKLEHLNDAVAAVDLQLDERELSELGETYAPRGIAGHR
jgi:1-deoxyxylulose-5-phosphate synthase